MEGVFLLPFLRFVGSLLCLLGPGQSLEMMGSGALTTTPGANCWRDDHGRLYVASFARSAINVLDLGSGAMKGVRVGSLVRSGG